MSFKVGMTILIAIELVLILAIFGLTDIGPLIRLLYTSL